MLQPDSSAEVDARLAEFRARAGAFCADVDRHTHMTESDFVATMSIHLGHLYSLGAYIARLLPDALKPETIAASHQLETKLFGPLEQYLQRTDRYRWAQVSYPENDDEDTTREGCLAGDLTDIYAYLYPILQSGGSEHIASVASHYTSSIAGRQTVAALQAIHEALYESCVFDDEP